MVIVDSTTIIGPAQWLLDHFDLPCATRAHIEDIIKQTDVTIEQLAFLEMVENVYRRK